MSAPTMAVLGGGISGLSAGYYLMRRFGSPLTIYEATPRIGGWIRTERHKDRGFIFESGPRTIRPKGLPGANTLELIDELKLPITPIPSKHVAARNRMIYAKGQLCLLPNSPAGIFGVKPPFSKPLYKAFLHDLMASATISKNGDESIYSFAERRFGKEIADYAISPMICGICAGNAKEISVRFLMDGLFEKEQKYGGVLKGLLWAKFKEKNTDTPGLFAEKKPDLYEVACRDKWAMYGVQNGLEQLPRALKKYLGENNVNVQMSSECRNLTFSGDGVQLNLRGQQTPVQHVISALPAYKLAPLVKTQHPSLAEQLLTIPYVDVVVVNLQFSGKHLIKQDGFGLLVPPLEKLPILGIIFDSCCFDMEDNTILTVMMGGHWFEQYFGNRPNQKQIYDIAIDQVRRILGIKDDPKFSRVNILHKCIPQYTVGHSRRVAAIRRYLKDHKLPLSVCGAAYDGVGINDVILSARRQVESLNLTHA